ncbi:MAG: ABC transporter permease [Chthoniobacterales bacterium]|nr:ABC transporter permease [Chthoniobacterales bacterium]
MNDLRYAARQLFKDPRFTIVAVLALAIGIGANTAIFSVVNAVLLKPLPFPQPEQLVAIGSADVRETPEAGALDSVSFPDFNDLRTQNTSLEHLALYRDRSFALGGLGDAQSLRGVVVSFGFFEALGVQPALGRVFRREEEAAGGGPEGMTTIISYELWQRQFKGDKDVLGSTVSLDGRPHTVIGIVPPGFQFPIQAEPYDVYTTTAYDATKAADDDVPNTEQRGNHSWQAIARMKPGITVERARAELRTIAAGLEKQYPDTNTDFTTALFPLRENMVGDVSGALYILFGAVGCVLLIGSANVANLLLARATVRGKEIAVRSALGASRARIVRQLLTESVLLSAVGGALGLMLAAWGTDVLVSLVPQSIPRASTIRLDGAVLAFTFAVALATGVLFGLAPALQASRLDLREALNESGRGTIGAGRQRVRSALVISEVALALLLLTGAGLLLQSFARLSRVNPGIKAEQLFTAVIALPGGAYPRPENVVNFYEQLLPRIKSLPGVEAASTIYPLPLSNSHMATSFQIEERPVAKGQQPDAAVRIAGIDFFTTAGIPLRRGRLFNERDARGTNPVMTVNERFAEKFFPGQDIVGKRIQPGMSVDPGDAPMREIIGVVGNIKAKSMSAELAPEMYLPATQVPISSAALLIRTATSNPANITAAVRAELARVDANVPLIRARIFEEYIARSLARARFNATLLSIFAGVALLLTAIGIYGVMAYNVAQRRQEIGIRMALGAQRADVLRLVVSGGMKLAAVGVALGVAAALALTRVLKSLLYGVTPFDPVTLSAVALLLSTIALLACWLPARRAASVNPLVALREG